MAKNAAAHSAIPPPISASTRIADLSTASTRVGRAAERFDGVASFGRRPTFDNGAPLLEIFLFDFEGDLYGATLDVAFIGFIREELKFDGVEALVRQMDDDSARARAALAANPGAFPKLGKIG
jgi:riboflavin kinase / FMN adenylyltransferase